MQSAIQAFQIPDDDLKEHSYVFFANTSKVMGPGFVPYLAELVPHLLAVITENELTVADTDDETMMMMKIILLVMRKVPMLERICV